MANTISMSKTPQAKNDVASVIEGNDVTIDVMANDLGGTAKSLYSVNQSNPLTSSTTATLPSGATISIVNGKIVYDQNDAFESLGAGVPATDTFTYAIQLANGTVSTATATVTVTGVNDDASISGDKTGSVTEDGTLTAGGTLTVTDVDTGEAVFQAVDPAALDTTYGAFTFDENTGAWTYTLDNTAAQSLTSTDVITETLTVQSKDGTASETITVTINGADEIQPVTETFFQLQTAAGQNFVWNLDDLPPPASGATLIVEAKGDYSLGWTHLEGLSLQVDTLSFNALGADNADQVIDEHFDSNYWKKEINISQTDLQAILADGEIDVHIDLFSEVNLVAAGDYVRLTLQYDGLV